MARSSALGAVVTAGIGRVGRVLTARRRRTAVATTGLVALVASLLVFLAAPADAAAPVIVNSSAAAWLESQSVPKDSNGQNLYVTFVVKHDLGTTVTGLAIDDDWNGTDNTSSLSPEGGASVTTLPNGSSNYSTIRYSWTPPNMPDFSCPLIGTRTRRTNETLRIRAVLSDGQRTAVTTASVHSVENNQCTGSDDFPFLKNQTQSATQITPGQSVTFTFQGDDADVSGDNDSFDKLRWRVRNLATGAVSGLTNVGGLSDNTNHTVTVTFPDRGRFVVEADLGGEDDGFNDFANANRFFRLGAVDVNSAASSHSLTLTPSPAVVNDGASTTVTASFTDPDSGDGGRAQMIRWDAADDGTYERRELAADEASGLTTAQRQQTISTTAGSCADRTVRAEVTDNGALNGADAIRRTRTATTTIVVNCAPTATAGATRIATEDTSLGITLSGNDPDGDTLTYTVVSGPSHGTLTSGSSAARTYTPAANYHGPDSFTFRVTDVHGRQSATVTVNITVNPVNDAPVAGDQTASTPEDTPVAIDFASPTISDIDGDTLTVSVATPPSTGSAAVTGPHQITYTPPANFHGVVAFQYSVSDGKGGSDTGVVTVTVDPVDDVPVAADQDVTTPEEAPITVVLGPTVDDDGEAITYALTGPASNGTATIDGNEATYTPTQDFHGVDDFTFSASDGNSSPMGTVTVTVTPVNDAPVATDQSVTTPEDEPLTITLAGSDVDGDSLTSTVTGVVHGSVDTLTGPTVVYTPFPDYAGSDTLTFVVDDGNGGTDTATVTIEVTPVNDAPVLDTLWFATDEDTPLAFTLEASDIEGDFLVIHVPIVPSNGALTGTEPDLVYTPALNYSGADTFGVRVDDGHGGITDAIVTVQVYPVNDPPVAEPQLVTTAEDQPVSITLAATDVDDELSELTFAVTDGPAHGTLSGDAPDLEYTPDLNFNGEDTFTFSVTDPDGLASTATVTVQVGPVNDAPVADDQAVSTDEDTPVTFDLTASDTDGDDLAYTIETEPGHGTVDLTGSTATYTPAPGFHGEDSFVFRVADDDGADFGTVTITVASVNDAPTADDQSVTTEEDTPLTFILTGDDVDGDELTFTVADGPQHGTIDTSDATVVYTPAPHYHGPDALTFVVQDGNGGTATGTISIEVTPVNDVPVADDQAVTTDEDTPVGVELTASDVDGDSLTFTLTDGPAHGTLSGDAPDLEYTPDLNFAGADSLSFVVDDGHGGTATGTVTITVEPVNDGPAATPQAEFTDEDTPVAITLTAIDVDDDPADLTFAVTSGPDHGTLSGDAPDLEYTPNADFHGDDAFTFSVTDPDGLSDTATVTLSVGPVNDAPVAEDDAVTTDEDTEVTITLPASDVDGDELTYAIETAPGHGTVQLTDGTATYTPNGDFHGEDTFAYRVDDGDVADTGTVTVTVLPVNDAPTADDQGLTTDEDTPVALELTGNDVDGDLLAFAVVDGPTNGTLSGDAPDLEYTPNADFHGIDSFTFSVDDGHGGTATGLVVLTVLPVNDAPVADDKAVSTDEDTPVTFDLSASDIDGDELTYTIETQPGHGTVDLSGTTVTYTPAPGYHGEDSFTFRVEDGDGADFGTVTLSIASVNDVPTAGDQAVTTEEDTPVAITLTGDDLDGDVLTFSVTDGPQHGTLSGDVPDLVYTPDEDVHGDDTFTFQVDDGNGGTATATVSITVTPVNDAPVADDQSVTLDEDTSVAVTLTGSDVDGDDLMFTVTTPPSLGTLSGDAPDLVYTPSLNANGADSFSFEVADGHGGTAIGTVSITVDPVNDAPNAVPQGVATEEDTPVSVTLTATDVDHGPSDLDLAISVGPEHGTLDLAAFPTVVYTPHADFHGDDAFSFTVTDAGGLSDTATVTVAVGPVNDHPVADDQAVTTDEDTPVTFEVSASDLDGDDLTYAIENAPGHGTAVLVGTTVTYTPALNFHGEDTLVFRVEDADSAAFGTVTLTVTSVNDAPEATPGSLVVVEDTPTPVTLAGTDADGDLLTYTVATAPAHGTLSGTGPDLVYTPDTDYTGPDGFTFTVTDPDGATSTATVTIEVEGVPLIGTTLEAEAAVLQVSLLKVRILGLVAHLHDVGTGAPVVGAPVVFSAGGSHLCTAVTDASGTARCGTVVTSLKALLALGYRADFAGDADRLPSTDHGALIGLDLDLT